MMNKPKGIIVFGANGSGKSTLGKELACLLNFKYMDIEDYYFKKSDIPYSKPRSKEEVIKLMLADIKRYGSFVISAVTGDFEDYITSLYDLAVFLSAPLDIRMQRIKDRAYEKFGNRVLQGGDMYESQKNFEEFARTRDLKIIDNWANTLSCPIIHIDGTKDYEQTAIGIANNYKLIKLDDRSTLPFTLDELAYTYNGIITNEVLKGIEPK